MRRLFLSSFALLVSSAAACAQPALRAGVARVDITPTKSMQMYGYANRKCGPSNGVHDPLYAKALVLQAGDSRMAIVTMDLGSMVAPDLGKRVASELNIPLLLLSASHSHSTPSFLPYGSNPVSNADGDAYFAELQDKIFGAIKEASGSMFPAKLALSRGSLQLGYNRLVLRDDGRSRALFDNMERIPYGPVDPEFVTLRVDDESGNQRALLVHYATHAVVLGPTNCKYSADWPGVMQAKVEQAVPGAQVMFVQGGAGDINPILEARSGNEEADFKVVQVMGETLAGEIVRANRSAKPVAEGPASIVSKSELLAFRNRWDKDKTMDVGITTVLINGQIGIAATPGEVMHRLQRQWKEQADVAVPLFYGYTYSAGGMWAGYVPDIRTAAYGGYGADVTTSIEVGAGETMMSHHLINLFGLRGMWRDTPGKP